MVIFEGAAAGIRAAYQALFPQGCLSCQRRHGPFGPSGLCENCLESLKLPPLNTCASCASPLDFTFEVDTGVEYFCGECRLNPPPFDYAKYALSYEGPVRQVIHEFKFGQSPYLAGPLAEMGKDRLAPWLAARKDALIVPVPLHWRRLHWRGYNHAYLLAKKLADMAGLAVAEGALTRTRHTQHQFGLSREERGKNVKAAFTATRPEMLAGRDVIILDDIITTGATARECCDTVLKCEPNSVSIATLCKAGG